MGIALVWSSIDDCPCRASQLWNLDFRYGAIAKIALQRLYPFEALVEISDFVTGLVQRVPKKPSFAKADLQNSTA